MKVKDLSVGVSEKVYLLKPAADYVRYKSSLLAFEERIGKEEAIRRYRDRLFRSR